MIFQTKVCNKLSLEYFTKCWKFGDNYKNSTVLIDPEFNILGFFDRKSESIDIVQSDETYNGDVLYAFSGDYQKGTDFIEYKVENGVKYKPLNYWRLIALEGLDKVNELKETIKNANSLIEKENAQSQLDYLEEKCLKRLKEYNKNYFTNLIKDV